MIEQIQKTVPRFTEYFEKVGVPDVDQEVKHLLVSYINGIQVGWKCHKLLRKV